VAGRIDLRRSVTSRLELREVDLGGALLLDEARSGAVVVDASTIRTSNDHGGSVLASSARIGGAVSFTDVQTASDVHLASTRAADLQWAGGRVGGSVRADRIQIDGSCALRGARLEGDVALVGARVAGDVQLGPSEFAGVVDLTRARIGGELHLARNTLRSGPTWGPASRLVLRDVTCEAIGGGAEAFGRDPEGTRSRPRLDFVPLDLVGLRYARVVGSGAEPVSTLARADARTLCRWLEAGVSHDGFTPEPWHQLADALARAGRPDGARFVRYEMRRYELRAERRLSRRAWLWLADVLIGHGYRSGRAVVWFVLLAGAAAVAGAWLTGPPLRASAEDGALLLRWFWFALDNGLPGIELDVAHRTFLADHSPAYRPPTIGLVSLFYVHALLGLVVLAYLAAGLSGLATGERRRG